MDIWDFRGRKKTHIVPGFVLDSRNITINNTDLVCAFIEPRTVFEKLLYSKGNSGMFVMSYSIYA